MGTAMYFSSQGSGKILGAVLAQSGRLLTIVVGGLTLLQMNASAGMMFGLIGLSLFVYGTGVAASVYFISWQPKRPLRAT